MLACKHSVAILICTHIFTQLTFLQVIDRLVDNNNIEFLSFTQVYHTDNRAEKMMSQLTYGGAYSHFETDYNNTGGNKSTDYEGNVNTRGGHKVLTNNSNNNNNNVAMNEQLVLGARRLPPERKVSKSESIHSGHFMISEIEESDTTLGDDDDDDDDDKMVGQDGAGGSSEKELLLPMTTHHESDYEHEPEESSASARLVVSSNAFLHTSLYGPTKVGLAGGTGSGGFVQIDESLAKLFKCMSLAYDGKITSPKWKAFKGVKLTVKDKIRLNNIIWRAWYIQCRLNRLR